MSGKGYSQCFRLCPVGIGGRDHTNVHGLVEANLAALPTSAKSTPCPALSSYQQSCPHRWRSACSSELSPCGQTLWKTVDRLAVSRRRARALRSERCVRRLVWRTESRPGATLLREASPASSSLQDRRQAPARARALYYVGPKRRGVPREANVSTKRKTAEAATRLSRPHGLPWRSRDPQASPGARPQATFRITVPLVAPGLPRRRPLPNLS